MKRLIQITSGCLKCKFIALKSTLLESDAYCRKDYEYPHIKDRSKWVGHCDHLDYDEESCSKFNYNLAFCRANARERLVLT